MRWFLPLASTVVLAACSSYEGTAPDGSLPDGSVVDSGGGTPAGDAGPGIPDASASSSSSSSSSGAGGDGGAYELTPEENLFLAKINDTRTNLAPGASPPLNPVIWDYSIGNGLRAWAGCGSSPPPLPPGSTTIYGGVDERMTADSLIQYMVDTRANYDRDTNTCSGGGSCEGYTNMVQRGVSRVACVFGSQICPPPLDGQNVSWRQWACTYAPLPDSNAKPY